MVTEYGSVKVLPVYEDNPFKVELNYVSKIFCESDEVERLFADTNTGEMFRAVELEKGDGVVVDATPFTKLYRGGYSELVKVLRMPSLHLLFLLFDFTQRDCNYVDVCEQDFFERYGYSTNSRKVYYTALLQLCNSGVIAKCAGHKNRYWININIFANGDRRGYMDESKIVKTQYRKRKKSKK